MESLLGDVRLVASAEEAVSAHAKAPSLTYVTEDGVAVLPDGRVHVGTLSTSESGALERKRRIRALESGMAELEEGLAAAGESLAEAEDALGNTGGNSAILFAYGEKDPEVLTDVVEDFSSGYDPSLIYSPDGQVTLLPHVEGESVSIQANTNGNYWPNINISGETLEKYKRKAYPTVIPIPSSSGSGGLGMAGIKADVERAVGTDILFNKED